MKKLAIIGIAILGLTLTIAVSQAGAYPGMSKAEYRAMMIRSGGLNQKYGIDVPVKGENYFARGLPVATVDQGKPAGMTQAEYRALMLRSDGLNEKYGIVPVRGENYFARGLPTSAPLAVTSEPASTPFQWTDAGIGAASLLVLTGLVGTAVFSVRHSGHLGTS